MRQRFHGQLEALGRRLADLCHDASDQLELASQALLARDPEMAGAVIERDGHLDRARDECELTALRLLALQAPVAGDLRTVLAAVYSADRLERMGDLARHIAEVVCRASPETLAPPPLADVFATMGRCAVAMGRDLTGLLLDTASEPYEELRLADRKVDDAHQYILTTVTGPDWTAGVAAGVNSALLARFHERFADQAVTIAARLEFAHTGAFPGNGKTPAQGSVEA